jgi:hypothetical protein
MSGSQTWIPDSSDLCMPPNTVNYNQKREPNGINWVSNSLAQNINSDLAPIYDKEDKLIQNVNAAQFEIKGHEREVYCGKKDKKGECEEYESTNVNFCGQVVLSAFLFQLFPSITTQKIADDLNFQEGTSAGILALYLNEKYGDYVHAEWISMVRNTSKGSLFFDYVTTMFLGREPTLIAPLVNIVSGNSGDDPEGVNGKLGLKSGANSGIPHWVLLTGISEEWRRNDDYSEYNWVRLFNPFDNQAEYYWWPDFKAAWQAASPEYFTAVKIRVIPHEDPLIRR